MIYSSTIPINRHLSWLSEFNLNLSTRFNLNLIKCFFFATSLKNLSTGKSLLTLMIQSVSDEVETFFLYSKQQLSHVCESLVGLR